MSAACRICAGVGTILEPLPRGPLSNRGWLCAACARTVNALRTDHAGDETLRVELLDVADPAPCTTCGVGRRFVAYVQGNARLAYKCRKCYGQDVDAGLVAALGTPEPAQIARIGDIPMPSQLHYVDGKVHIGPQTIATGPDPDRVARVVAADLDRAATVVLPPPLPNPDAPAIWDLVIDDMRARDAMGLEKYKQRLKPFDGRDALTDAYQEALDQAVYLRKEIYEREHPPVASAAARRDGLDNYAGLMAMFDEVANGGTGGFDTVRGFIARVRDGVVALEAERADAHRASIDWATEAGKRANERDALRSAELVNEKWAKLIAKLSQIVGVRNGEPLAEAVQRRMDDARRDRESNGQLYSARRAREESEKRVKELTENVEGLARDRDTEIARATAAELSAKVAENSGRALLTTIKRQRARITAEREFFMAWLLRARMAIDRQGWEEGTSAEETSDAVVSVLFNLGIDTGTERPADVEESARLLALPIAYALPSDVEVAELADDEPRDRPGGEG